MNETSAELKIYGIFRSGTNLLKFIVERHMNAVCRANIGGHKHLFTTVNWNADGYIDPRQDILFCVKDPYASILSLFRYGQITNFKHFRCATQWNSFLTSPFVVSISHRTHPPSFWFRTPVDYWLAHCFHMLSLPTETRLVVRYEDVIFDPNLVLAEIASHFPKAKVIRQVEALPLKRIGRFGENVHADAFESDEFNRKWYDQKRFLESYSESQLLFLREILDNEIVSGLGYMIV